MKWGTQATHREGFIALPSGVTQGKKSGTAD